MVCMWCFVWKDAVGEKMCMSPTNEIPLTADARTPKEKEEDEAFWKAFDELYEYLEKKSNCTILQS